MRKKPTPKRPAWDDYDRPDGFAVQAELVNLVARRIRRLKMTQSQAAERLGLKQPNVSKIMNGRYGGFSTERLFRFLNALDQDIQIVVMAKPEKARRAGTVTVRSKAR